MALNGSLCISLFRWSVICWEKVERRKLTNPNNLWAKTWYCRSICKEQFFIDIDSVHEPGSDTSKLTDLPRISGNGSKNLELQRKWRHGYFGDIFGTPFWPQKWIPNVRQMLSLVTSSSLQIAGQVRQIFQLGTNILASVANSKWDKDFSLRQILPPSVFVLSLQVVDIEGQQVYVYSIQCIQRWDSASTLTITLQRVLSDRQKYSRN